MMGLQKDGTLKIYTDTHFGGLYVRFLGMSMDGNGDVQPVFNVMIWSHPSETAVKNIFFWFQKEKFHEK